MRFLTSNTVSVHVVCEVPQHQFHFSGLYSGCPQDDIICSLSHCTENMRNPRPFFARVRFPCFSHEFNHKKKRFFLSGLDFCRIGDILKCLMTIITDAGVIR